MVLRHRNVLSQQDSDEQEHLLPKGPNPIQSVIDDPASFSWIWNLSSCNSLLVGGFVIIFVVLLVIGRTTTWIEISRPTFPIQSFQSDLWNPTSSKLFLSQNQTVLFLGDSLVRFTANAMIESLSENLDYCTGTDNEGCLNKRKYNNTQYCHLLESCPGGHLNHVNHRNENTIISIGLKGFWWFSQIQENCVDFINETLNQQATIDFLVIGTSLHETHRSVEEVQRFTKQVLDHVMSLHPRYIKHIIWMNAHWRNLALVDVRYRYQTNERTLKNNKATFDIVRQYANVSFYDPYYLTQHHPNQTNDGTHWSYDVNLMKSEHLIKMFDNMLQSKQAVYCFVTEYMAGDNLVCL